MLDSILSYLYEYVGVLNPKVSLVVVITVGGLFGGFLAAVFWDSAGKSYRRLHAPTPPLNVTVTESPNAELRTRLAEKENEVTRLSGVVDRLQNDLRASEAKKAELQQQLDDRQRRRQLRDKLGEFAEKGRQLMAQCANESNPPPEKEADAWASETEAFLRANLGDGYVARFRSGAGLPLTANSIYSIPHRNLWGGINIRVARLNEFIAELR